MNWGVSQYLPITKDQKLLMAVGLTGYDQWKLTEDTGSDARNGDVLDEVHAFGGQFGLTYTPWNLAVNLRYDHEYASVARFQGQVLVFSIVLKL